MDIDTGVDQSEGYVARVKREENVFDPKCNSEDLKAIIVAVSFYSRF